MGTGGDPAFSAIQPSMPTHHLHRPLVLGFGGAAASRWYLQINAVSRPKVTSGAVDVVVDRLWHPRPPAHSLPESQLAVGVPSPPVRIRTTPLSSGLHDLGAAPPAVCQGAPGPFLSHLPPLVAASHCGRRCAVGLQRFSSGLKAVLRKSDHRRAVSGVAGTHHRTDDGVKARTVASGVRTQSTPHHLAAGL